MLSSMELRDVGLMALTSALALLCAHLWMRLQRTRPRHQATQTEAKTLEEWMEFTIEALKEHAHAEGLATSGLKVDLAARLVNKRAMLEAQTAVV